MILIQHNSTGDRQCVESLNGYDENWTQIGPELPDGSNVDNLALVGGEWVASPQRARDARWQAAQAYRERRRNAPLPVWGVFAERAVVAKMDVESRLTIAGAVQMATLMKGEGLPFSFTFDDEAGQETTIDADQTIALGLGVAAFSGLCDNALRGVRRALDDALSAGATVAAIDEIDITAGYPGAPGAGDPPAEPES